MKDIKWLLVGAGDIAQKRVGAALRDAKHSKLVAVCDINEERVRSLVNEFSVEQSFTSLEEALEKSIVMRYTSPRQSIYMCPRRF